jgi:O-antigen/teichoic acid export membrane protein
MSIGIEDSDSSSRILAPQSPPGVEWLATPWDRYCHIVSNTDRDPAVPGAVTSALKLIGIGAGIRFLGEVAAATMGVLSLSLTVRLLSQRDYGQLALLLSVVAMASGLTRVGAGTGITRTAAALHEERIEMKHFASSLLAFVLVSGAVGTGLLALVGLASPRANGSQGMAAALLLGLFLLGSTATWACSSLARGLQKLVVMEASRLLIPGLRLLIMLVLTILAWNTLSAVGIGLALAGAMSGLVSVLLIAWVSGASLPAIREVPNAFMSVARISSPYAAVGLALVTVASLDVLVLGLFRSAEVVGGYEPALRLTDRLMQLPPVLASVGYLPVAMRFGSEDRVGQRLLYSQVSRSVFAIGGCVAAYLAVHASLILRFVYGSDEGTTPAIIWMLLPGYIVNVALGVNITALTSAGERRRLFVVGAGATVMMIVFGFALIPTMGATGAALATTLTMSGFNILASWHLYRATGIPAWDKGTIVTWLSWFLLFGLMSLTAQVVDQPITVLAVSGALSGVWLIALWSFGLVAIGPIRGRR